MSKILVAYFSASGVTKAAAEKMAKEMDADLFEIRPPVPYSEGDLDWRNKKSRSTIEMRDRKSRPELAENIDITPYDQIYIGFPIWWGVAPHIIYTFLESHNFRGKEIFPFATSGGSGFGLTGNDIKTCAPQAVVHPGKIVR